MPTVKKKPPKHLRPYVFHGMELDWESGETQITVDCPFCSREGHFSVNRDTGQWRCLSCGQGSDKGGGNEYTFLRLLWDRSFEATIKGYKALGETRGLQPDTLARWGFCRSLLTGDWLLPAYSGQSKIVQLYKLVHVRGRVIMMATPKSGTSGQGLFGANLYETGKPDVYLCEGPWDGMHLWEELSKWCMKEEELVPTPSPRASLYAYSNVLAVPGCNTFSNSWLKFFEGKVVHLMYDNDHPKVDPRTGRSIPPAGLAGMERVSRVLQEVTKDIRYLKWSESGYDEQLPSGYDVGDFLNA